MKKYSQVIPQKINEGATIGKQVKLKEEELKTFLTVVSKLNKDVPGYKEGIELFQKDDILFIKCPGKGLYTLYFGVENDGK